MRRRGFIVGPVLLSFLTGCGALPALPFVIEGISVVSEALPIIDAIADFVQKRFLKTPNPELEAKVDDALEKTRATLAAAGHAARAAKAASEKDMSGAIEEFVKAYCELLALVEPLGISVAGAGLKASPGGDKLQVPAPESFKIAR